MRKRIAIGLLGVLVLGVLAIIILQPRKGSVEWHKREYLAAWRWLHDVTWGNRLRAMFYGPSRLERTSKREAAENQIDFHWAALVRLGYMRDRTFVFTNRTAADVLRVTEKQRLAVLPVEQMPFVGFRFVGTNELVLTAPPEIISTWEELIRKADGP